MMKIDEMARSGPITSFCHQRLQIIEHKFQLYLSLNVAAEIRVLRNANEKKSFQNVHKVDSHINVAGAASPQLLVSYIQEQLQKNQHAKVVEDPKTGKEVTLVQVFSQMGVGVEDLNVQTLKNTEAMDGIFYPFDSPQLRDLFLETDYRNGKFSAGLTRTWLDQLEQNEVLKAELHVPIYGRLHGGLQAVADWVDTNDLYSSGSRWVIQIPRKFHRIKVGKSGSFDTYAAFIESIFQPLFEVTKIPVSNPALHRFLLHVTGVNTIGEHGNTDFQTVDPQKSADKWTEDPPYIYHMYYVYANIYALNEYRKYRGLNTFAFKPHCGETGPVSNLTAGYLLGSGINHGINLRSGGLLQYLFYLFQIPIAISPICNDYSSTEMDRNPFARLVPLLLCLVCSFSPTQILLSANCFPNCRFFRRGLNVCLSTENPLVCHNVDDPLMEEYFNAAQAWGLSEVDLSEIARASVLSSGFWGIGIGNGTANGNDATLTLVPDIRLSFRSDTLVDENEFLRITVSKIGPQVLEFYAPPKSDMYSEIAISYPVEFSDANAEVSYMFNFALQRRSAYARRRSSESARSQKIKIYMNQGVLSTDASKGAASRCPSPDIFIEDLATMMILLRDKEAQTFAESRLQCLEGCFNLHLRHNGVGEHDEVRYEKADFYTLNKLNNGTLRSMLKSEHISDFLRRNVHTLAGHETLELYDGDQMTVSEYFRQLEGCYRGGMPSRDLELLIGAAILNPDNVTAGRLLGKLTAELLDTFSAAGDTVELTLPLIGYNEDEWENLADWIQDHKLMRPWLRFRISVIVSEYPDIRLDKDVRNFEHYMSNIFWSICEASNDPNGNRELASLLEVVNVIEIHSLFRTDADDVYSAETTSSFQLNWFKVSPNVWSSADMPPVEYVEYYCYANITALNELRRTRGQNTLNFQPFVSEKVHSSARQLAVSFLLGDQVCNGTALLHNVQLQYAYYLAQTSVTCSPVSERDSFTRYRDHPFGMFFRRGLNVCIGASDQEHRRITRHPLLDEFFMAKRTWALSNIDLCEIACNSAKTKAAELQFLTKSKDQLTQLLVAKNDKSKTNIPNIRIKFRSKLLIEEMQILETMAASFQISQSVPAGQQAGRLLHRTPSADLWEGLQEDEGSGCLCGLWEGWKAKREDAKINTIMTENERLKSKLEALVGEGPGQGYTGGEAETGDAYGGVSGDASGTYRSRSRSRSRSAHTTHSRSLSLTVSLSHVQAFPTTHT
jgi:AMP deaminase